MFLVIVACFLFVVAANESEILGYENNNDGSGNYRFRFMTPDGITRKETGRLVDLGENNKYIDVDGSYSYTDPDGKEIIVNYSADENGYHILPENFRPEVKGAHLNVCLAMIYMALVTVHLTGCLGAQIKKNTFNNNGLGAYSFEYETSDGSYRKEEGGLVTKGGTRYLVVRGEYGYKDTLGKKYSMTYLADDNGYRPTINGDHIRFNDRKII